MNDVNNKFIKTLIELRGKQSIYAVSKAMGIQRATLHNYELGKKVPEDRNLELLCAFYGVPFEDLKLLIFDDQYPEGSRDREILQRLLCSKRS